MGEETPHTYKKLRALHYFDWELHTLNKYTNVTISWETYLSNNSTNNVNGIET